MPRAIFFLLLSLDALFSSSCNLELSSPPSNCLNVFFDCDNSFLIFKYYGGKVGGSRQLYGFLIFFRTENPENMMSPLEMQVDQQYVHPREIQKGMGKGMGKALGV